MLHAAGLTVARKSEDGENWDVTLPIVTREARGAGGEVHDRMPVFLTDGAVAEWLIPRELEAERKGPLLAQLVDVSTVVAGSSSWPLVDRQVDNVRTLDRTDPSLIAPLEVWGSGHAACGGGRAGAAELANRVEAGAEDMGPAHIRGVQLGEPKAPSLLASHELN